jgi:hypothetical protein
MVRAKIWFRCAIVHDPVSPYLVKPSLISWEAKYRKIDLVIERGFSGEELVRRMKGWITVDPIKVIEVVSRFGRLKILDDMELVVELAGETKLKELQEEVKNEFGDQVDIELRQKQ